MRIFLIISLLALATTLISQEENTALEFVEASLDEVINVLEGKYNFLISYENLEELERALKNKTINFSSSSHSRIKQLQELFDFLNLDYEMIDDDQLVIKALEQKSSLFCGQLIDELSGDPLAYANIISQDSSFGISANEVGIFFLPEEEIGKKKFIASYVGYEKLSFSWNELNRCRVSDNEIVSSGCTPEKIRMKTPTFSIPYLVIKDYLTDGIDLKDNGLSTVVKPKFIGALPGQVDPDILQTIQFLPGVSSPSSKSSDIFIRGGTPDQSLILWEDIPLYHSAHYFGLISAIDPYVVSEMKVFRGGFDASYGGRASGVIDIKSHGIKDKDTFVGVASNLVFSCLDGHQFVGKKKKASLTFSLRRSFAELWESPTFKNYSKLNQQGLVLGDKELFSTTDNIGILNKFKFQDAHLKFEAKLGVNTTLTTAGIYASNDFNDEIKDDISKLSQLDTLRLNNKGVNLKLNHQWSERLETVLKFIGTDYSYTYNFEVFDFERDENEIDGLKSNQIVDQEIQLSTTYELINQQFVELGYQFTNYDISFETEKLSNKYREIRDRGKTASKLHSAYLTYKNPIQNKFGIDLGLRVNYFLETKGFNYEPRLKLSYQVTDFLSAHVNYGQHYQYIGQVTDFRGSDFGFSTSLWALAENKSIPIQKATQGQLGFIFNKSNWVVDLQVYSKKIQGLSSRAYDFEDADGMQQSIGEAMIKGLDVFVKRRLNKNMKIWASYTFSQIQMNFPEISSELFPSDYDERHNLQLATQMKFGKLQVASGIKYSSGLPYTDIKNFDPPPPMSQDARIRINYDNINSKNLVDLFELNLSTNYGFELFNKTEKCFVGASLINVLNKTNTYSRTAYVLTRREEMPSIQFLDRVNLPTTLNLSLRLEL